MRFKFLLLVAFFATTLRAQDVVLPPEEVTPVFERSLFSTGNWGSVAVGAVKNYKNIQAQAKRTVHVVILDTGSGWNHEALDKVARAGKSFTGEPIGPDKQGHSTHVAGIVAARNGVDHLGVAEALVDIGMIHLYPYKVLSDAGSGTYQQIANGLNQAAIDFAPMVKRGDFVILNLSLGGNGFSSAVDAAMKACWDAGFAIFVAAGNTGQDGVQYPGRNVHARAIAALEQTAEFMKRAPYSTKGPEVWMAGPGSAIWSPYVPNRNTYAYLSGTSMGTPMVAGLAAILASTKHKYNRDQVLASMESIATDILPAGRDTETGHGVTMVDRILALPSDPVARPEPPKPEPPKPEPPKETYPKQTNVVDIERVLSARWSNYGKNNWQDTRFRMTVEYTHAGQIDQELFNVERKTLEHFTNRGYMLLEKDDTQRALYWFAYFYEMILKKEGYDVRVVSIRTDDDKAYQLVLDNPVRGRPTQAKVVKRGITSFNLIR